MSICYKKYSINILCIIQAESCKNFHNINITKQQLKLKTIFLTIDGGYNGCN